MNEQRQREEAHRIRIAYETVRERHIDETLHLLSNSSHLSPFLATNHDQELQRKKAATATVEVAQQIRNRVRIKEDERTRKVVNRHRIEKASTVPPSELQSLPLQQINLNFLSTQTALSASTTNVPIKKAQSKIGRAMFDETCHHRDYAAVRCDRPVPMEETAAQVAKLVSERTERKAVKAANEIKIYNQHAKQRFNKAMDVVTLEKVEFLSLIMVGLSYILKLNFLNRKKLRSSRHSINCVWKIIGAARKFAPKVLTRLLRTEPLLEKMI